MLEGREFEYGSIEESIAIYAKQKLNRIKRLEVILDTRASLVVANAIINPSEVKFDGVQKLLDHYSETVFPEIAEDREDAAKKVRDQMVRESKQILRVSAVPSMGDGNRLRKRR